MSGPVIVSDAPHTVEALCPLCRIRVEVPVTLQTLVKVTSAKTVIHITLLQDTTLHTCGQLRVDDAIDVEVVDAEIVFDDGAAMAALPYLDAETGEIVGAGNLP